MNDDRDFPAHRGAEKAKQRWFAIQAVRWSGVGILIFGLLIIAGKLDLPEIAGYFLMGVGLLDALFVPTFLARLWKTPL